MYEIAIKIWFGFGLWYECDNNVSIFFESKLDAIVYKTLFSEIGENGLAVFSKIGENGLAVFSEIGESLNGKFLETGGVTHPHPPPPGRAAPDDILIFYFIFFKKLYMEDEKKKLLVNKVLFSWRRQERGKKHFFLFIAIFIQCF